MEENKWSFSQEIGRKIIHFLTIFVLMIYLLIDHYYNKQIALMFLVFALIIDLELEYFRLDSKIKIPILNYVWGKFRREKEKEHVGSDIYFLIAAIIVFSVFDKRIAVVAILMTLFGDLSAAIIGTRFGKHKLGFLKDRSYEGVISEFIVDIIIAVVVLTYGNYMQIFSIKLILLSIVMALIATIVETKIYKVDDNLFVPIATGFVGQIMLFIFSYFRI